jgi:ribosomal protein L4
MMADAEGPAHGRAPNDGERRTTRRKPVHQEQSPKARLDEIPDRSEAVHRPKGDIVFPADQQMAEHGIPAKTRNAAR